MPKSFTNQCQTRNHPRHRFKPTRCEISGLGRALEAAGNVRKAGDAAHHIVAGSAPGAAEARATLQGLGIGLDDAANGVFLQSAEHASVHTAEYYAAVNRALAAVKKRAEAERVLQSIAQGLKSGTFP
jgi:hypothetical protein